MLVKFENNIMFPVLQSDETYQHVPLLTAHLNFDRCVKFQSIEALKLFLNGQKTQRISKFDKSLRKTGVNFKIFFVTCVLVALW